MGCCLSSATSTDKSSSAQKHPHFPRSEEEEEDSRAPPPVVDEETVKEVLSETPNPKQEPFLDHRNRAHHQEEEDNNTVFYELKLDRTEEEEEIHDKKTTTTTTTTTQEPVFVQKPKLVEFEKKSTLETSDQASEICSVSNDSVSTTTAVTRDEEEDDEVVHQPPRRFNYDKSNRTSPVKVQSSPSSFGPPSRREQFHQQNRVVGVSPTRRVESSPGRMYGAGSGARVVHQQQQTVRIRRVGSNRRDPGESSGRRSRSPATRVTPEGSGGVNNVGRSPSAKRSGRYPGRTSVGPVESSGGPARRLAEEPKMESNYPANESLDNPLVSLECFIFL